MPFPRRKLTLKIYMTLQRDAPMVPISAELGLLEGFAHELLPSRWGPSSEIHLSVIATYPGPDFNPENMVAAVSEMLDRFQKQTPVTCSHIEALEVTL